VIFTVDKGERKKVQQMNPTFVNIASFLKKHDFDNVFHTVEVGLHMIKRFENGYGVSIIQTQYSYGGKNEKYEMAVLNHGGGICYTSGITDDVLGHLTLEECDSYIHQVKELMPNEKARSAILANRDGNGSQA